VIEAAALGTKQEVPFVQDAAALIEMPNRPGGVCGT
jgi:hypothetical protein